MSDIKSYQRLLAVQAIYETLINKNEHGGNFDEVILHIIQNVDFKNKICSSQLLLTKEICSGVFTHLEEIDFILEKSVTNKSKVRYFDKLLLSIFRCAIYEISFKKEISKTIIISDYLLISNQFFGNKEAALLNGVLDNLRQI